MTHPYYAVTYYPGSWTGARAPSSGAASLTGLHRYGVVKCEACAGKGSVARGRRNALHQCDACGGSGEALGYRPARLDEVIEAADRLRPKPERPAARTQPPRTKKGNA